TTAAVPEAPPAGATVDTAPVMPAASAGPAPTEAPTEAGVPPVRALVAAEDRAWYEGLDPFYRNAGHDELMEAWRAGELSTDDVALIYRMRSVEAEEAVADALDRPAQYLVREGETSSVLPPEDGLVPVVLPDGSGVKAAHWQVIRTDEGLVYLPIDDPVVENARRSVAVGDEVEAAELATQATPSAQGPLNPLPAPHHPQGTGGTAG